MSWEGQMVTIVRHLIDDTDPDSYDFTNKRLETTILATAQLLVVTTSFENDYTINVEQCTLDPDPTTTATKDEAFITLVCLKAACVILGGKIRSESGNAISIKDGPSAIDLKGVTSTLMDLYKHLCEEFEQVHLDYRAGASVAGHAILGPYSPGSDLVRRNSWGYRNDRF